MPDKKDAEAIRQIEILVQDPRLEWWKDLAENLVTALVSQLPADVAVDRPRMFRSCIAALLIADGEATRRARELTDLKSRRIDSLKALVGSQRELLGVKTDLVGKLAGIVEDQDDIIAVQSRVIEAAIEGDGLRELRLPH
jgi:hypothetical protein